MLIVVEYFYTCSIGVYHVTSPGTLVSEAVCFRKMKYFARLADLIGYQGSHFRDLLKWTCVCA